MRDGRRVELRERDSTPCDLTSTSPLMRAEQRHQHEREREREAERARRAQGHPHAGGDPAPEQRGGRSGERRWRSCGLLGQLEVDVLEGRAGRSRGPRAPRRARRRRRWPARGRASAWRSGSARSRPPIAVAHGGQRAPRPSSPGAPSAMIAAAGEHDDAVGERVRLVHVVGGQQDRLAEVRAAGRSAPTSGAGRPGRSRWSARRGRSARDRRRGRARGPGGGAGRPRASRRGRRRGRRGRRARAPRRRAAGAGRRRRRARPPRGR